MCADLKTNTYIVRPRSICKYPGCGKTIAAPGYCDKHESIAHQQIILRKNNRSQDHTKMYNWSWKKLRARLLKESPLCISCKDKNIITPATVIDHIKPHRGDKNLFWDEMNLQALCKACHDAKTAREDGGFGNQKGWGRE